MKRKKTAIYGAGNYCKAFFQGGFADKYDIVEIIDSAPQKKGEVLFGVSVSNLSEACICEEYIIAVRDKEPIVDILTHHGIHCNQISIFDGEKGVVYPYKKDLEYRFMVANCEKQICFSLLRETYDAGEYTDYNRIIVLGEEKHYCWIKDFFSVVEDTYEVILKKQLDISYKKDKYIITGKDYKKIVKDIKTHKEIDSKQWLILPFFDVRDTIL